METVFSDYIQRLRLSSVGTSSGVNSCSEVKELQSQATQRLQLGMKDTAFHRVSDMCIVPNRNIKNGSLKCDGWKWEVELK